MTDPTRLELVPGTPAHGTHVPDLVWSTGPSSYRYIFGGRAPFEMRMVLRLAGGRP